MSFQRMAARWPRAGAPRPPSNAILDPPPHLAHYGCPCDWWHRVRRAGAHWADPDREASDVEAMLEGALMLERELQGVRGLEMPMRSEPSKGRCVRFPTPPCPRLSMVPPTLF
jgi:hypothetical protein